MKYSIITINYNNKRGLEKTIQSIINQTYKDYEYIIIDGGSTDGSVDIITKYSDKINYWVSEPDNGVYHAMNKGISKANGLFLNFMNSGDSFHSATTLELISKEIDSTDILIGKCCNASTGNIYGNLQTGTDITLLTLMKEMINHQSTFYRKTILDKHPYDERLKIVSDWKVNIQTIIFDNCKVNVTDTIVADYDMNGISSTNGKLYLEEKVTVLNELFPKRILEDYNKLYTDKELPIVTLLPLLKKTERIQHIVYLFTKLLLKFRRK